jgi:hypothetical protein
MAAFGIAVTLFACKGDTGPAGPQGPAGANGVSNLSVTNLTVTPGDWLTVNAYNWQDITSAFIPSTDVCIVYASPNNSTFTALPWSDIQNVTDELLFSYGSGNLVTLEYYNPNLNSLSSTWYFNIADIPPAVMKQHPKTNWKNWSEVSAIIQAQKMMNNQ